MIAARWCLAPQHDDGHMRQSLLLEISITTTAIGESSPLLLFRREPAPPLLCGVHAGSHAARLPSGWGVPQWRSECLAAPTTSLNFVTNFAHLATVTLAKRLCGAGIGRRGVEKREKLFYHPISHQQRRFSHTLSPISRRTVPSKHYLGLRSIYSPGDHEQEGLWSIHPQKQSAFIPNLQSPNLAISTTSLRRIKYRREYTASLSSQSNPLISCLHSVKVNFPLPSQPPPTRSRTLPESHAIEATLESLFRWRGPGAGGGEVS
jgi:hypothetical protein